MRSDERTTLALAALAPRRATFRAALAAAREQVCAHLASHGSGPRDRMVEAVAELGPFAGGRIDATRFAAITATTPELDASTEQMVLRCADVLDDLLDRGDGLFTPVVHAGGDLRATVHGALAEAGRAFGAVAAFQAIRSGSFDPVRHEPGLLAFPFARWNRAERDIGVPLVVQVSGADLCAEALAEFLDGHQQIVLVVDGPCAPAPLARLATPGVLALQTDGDLASLAGFAGAAIAAIVPDGAALFTSDPRTGTVVVRREATEPRASVGGWSRAQQREQLAQLAALRRTLGSAPQTKEAAEAADAADAADATDSRGAVQNDNQRQSVASVASAAPLVGAAGPSGGSSGRGSDDERLIGNVAEWLLANAGLKETGAAS